MRNTVFEKSRRRLFVLSVGTLLISIAGGGLFALHQWQSVKQYRQLRAKADVALDNEQYELAVHELARCLAYYPQDAKLLADYVEAQNHVEDQTHRNMELTIDVLNRSLMTYPASHEAASQLADMYLASGDAMQAIHVANKTLARLPDNLQMLKRRALANTRMGNLQDAMVDVDRCINLEPADYDLYLLRLILIKRSDRTGVELLEHVQNWRATLANNAWSDALMGVACRLLELDQEALNWFKVSAAHAGEDTQLLNLLVNQFNALGHYTQADQLLENVDVTKSPLLLYRKAWTLWQKQLDRDLLQLPHMDIPQVIALQVMAHKRSGQAEAIKPLLANLSERSGDRVVGAWLKLLECVSIANNATPLQIIDAAQQVRINCSKHELADVILAQQWEALGEKSAALEVWRCLSATVPSWTIPYLHQSRLLLDLQYPLAAAASARAILARDPGDLSAGVLLVEALGRAGTEQSHQVAHTLFDELAPGLTDDVRLILASKLLDTQIAKELIANAISLDRSLSSHTWSTLAQISLDRQASWHDDCLMQLQKQHGVTPQWLILKAQALHEVGKTVTARQLIISHVNKQTLQQSADTVQWQLVQARFLTMIGDHLAAHLAWQHLINTYPNNLTVTKSILEQPTENQQMALRQKAIDQLHRRIQCNCIVFLFLG